MEKQGRLIKELLGILGILPLLFEVYGFLRRYWLRRLLEKRKSEKRTRKPAVLRPKSEKDCRFCRADKRTEVRRELPISWQMRKGRGGPKKKIQTESFFCPNTSCEYYGITEEAIQDFKCQACGKKFTARRNTILYRLKSHSELIEKILWLLALGVVASALEEVFGVREITIRTWLCRKCITWMETAKTMLCETWCCCMVTVMIRFIRAESVCDKDRCAEELIDGKLITISSGVAVRGVIPSPTITLCPNRSFWEMGNRGGEEAGLGAVE